MVDTSMIFSEIKVPEQKHFRNANDDDVIVFPTVISPNNQTELSKSDFTKAIQTQKQLSLSLLEKTGAVLFRGYPMRTAADFNDIVEAFGFDELPYVGGAAPRFKVVGRVFTANEAPPDRKIHFHQEMAQVPEYPAKLFFFCEVEPSSGGETPIVLSHVVYERMKEKHPEFVKKLEALGLIYSRVLSEEDDLLSPSGLGWKSTFGTNDKNVAEERAAKLGIKLEWTEYGVKTIMGPLQAVKYDKLRQRKTWFNSMVAFYIGYQDAPYYSMVTFGDGEPLPTDIIYDCLNILEEESVAIPWQKGDLLLIDNLAVLHSRRSFDPPRRVLASLCK